MHLTSPSFDNHGPIPPDFAFARIDPDTHATLAGNKNPAFEWGGLPDGCLSLVLVCVDPDAPTVGDDVNQEGRSVAHDLPRADFHHWGLVDVPPHVPGIGEGECSDGVTKGGKSDPPGPPGSRQAVSDFTAWFASDPDMAGTYKGYDGPGPPWNDERAHRYHFRLYALDVERCPVEGDFTVQDVRAAIDGHVLGEAEWTGTYTLNPNL
ncbi:MAG: YbhB/YbcL family Raf kinase inhibitor-like protein [bacterium]|nr:YbhB/YbcL family Raf kinase inhibitor-like protein [bacterium]